MPFFDAHNHLHDLRLGNLPPVIAAMRKEGITHAVVNATSESDWGAVECLHLAHPDFILTAFGIHPWKADTVGDGWQTRLLALLEKHPSASVGECGLDRWISSPGIEVQKPVFLAQLELARDLGRPVTIHCLKAWEALFDCFDRQPPPPRFLMHSFGGSIEIARRLLPLGAYFSFSGYFLHPRKSAVLDVFRQLPRDRILIETDAPDMLPPESSITHPLPDSLNHPANLPSIAAGLAGALEIPVTDLACITRQNAYDLFSSRI